MQAALTLSEFVGSRALASRLENATGYVLAALGENVMQNVTFQQISDNLVE